MLQGGIQNAVIALAAVSWPKYARLARSQTLTVKNLTYSQAAKLSGTSSFGILFRHILPNIAGPVLVTAMLDIGTMMMEIAALSFLGLGAQPPTAEWGSMMSSGRSMLQTYPWVVLTPGLGIFVSVALFNLLGDTVRDTLDPRERTEKKEKIKMKKRMLTLLLAAGLLVSMLAGCGGGNTESGSDIGSVSAGSGSGEKALVWGDTTFNAENGEPDINPHRGQQRLGLYPLRSRRDPVPVLGFHGGGALAGGEL